MKKLGEYTRLLSVVFLGCMLVGIGINSFLLPNRLSAGGISSLGAVVLYLFGIPLSVTNLLFNVGMIFWGAHVLGWRAVGKTGIGTVLLSVCLELSARMPSYVGSLAPASLIGGALIGSGIGLVIRTGASTGGSDFAALIFAHTHSRFSIGRVILFLDSAIILLAWSVTGSLRTTLYSLFSMYLCTKLTDLIIEGNMFFQSSKKA